MTWIKPTVLSLICLLAACKSVNYSFSGVSIDCTKEPTLSVKMFADNSEGGPATLSQNFTEQVREYYQNNTCLALTPYNGDYQLQGSIVGYNISPQAPTGNEQAALMRLTITVKVDYMAPEEGASFEGKKFSFFSDYPQDQNLASIEEQLIAEITEQIILDMFNATVATW